MTFCLLITDSLHKLEGGIRKILRAFSIFCRVFLPNMIEIPSDQHAASKSLKRFIHTTMLGWCLKGTTLTTENPFFRKIVSMNKVITYCAEEFKRELTILCNKSCHQFTHTDQPSTTNLYLQSQADTQRHHNLQLLATTLNKKISWT